MHKCNYLARGLISILVPVCHFLNVSSATTATTTDGNIVANALQIPTTNQFTLKEAPRVEFSYSRDTFKEIEPAVLQYVDDTSPYLYRQGETIRARVIELNQHIVHLPCILKYPLHKISDGKNKLQLFKNGKLIDDAFRYIPEFGYYLNVKRLENPLGTYECRVTNSTNDVVFVELDNGIFINVRYIGHDDFFYAGEPYLNPFECKLPKDIYEFDFKWYYLWMNGEYKPLNGIILYNSSDASYYMQTVMITFTESNIVGVVCAGTIKDSESSNNNSYQVFVKQPNPPRILNKKYNKPIIYVSGMNLTCVASGDPVYFEWLKNGKHLNNGEHIENYRKLPYRSTLVLKQMLDDIDTTYSCTVFNFLGSAIYYYRVQLAPTVVPVPAHPVFEWKYLIIAGVISTFLLILLLGIFLTFFRVEVTSRQLDSNAMDWFFKGNATDIPDNEMEPYALASYDSTNEIEYHKLNFVRELKGGNFGQVHLGWFRDIATDTQIPVAIKQISDDPSALEDDFKHEFMCFLNEIKIMQCIGYHRHVVSYIGAVTSDINNYSAHLVVEYHSEGDLSSYLKTFRKSEGLLHDDIQGLHHLQSGNQSISGQVVLKTSHLMRWAQEMADGMHYIASKGIVHRDLAARNVLLGYQGVNSDEYENMDPGRLIAKISDFGLSRDLYENDNEKDYYVVVFDQIQESIRRRRQPLRWLSIEALRTLKFTMKSDVWALGVTYWEMFTLANDVPYAEEVPECDDMRQALITFRENGGSLSQPEHASSELWNMMLDCWQDNPEDRPDFNIIRENLKTTNESFVEDSNSSNRSSNVYEQQPQLEVSEQERIAPYSTVGILDSLGYIMLNYTEQSDLANEGDSVRDEDESENARQNCSNSPHQNSSIPNADLTVASDLIVGYVENRDYYNNMEMEQYHYSGDITTDEEDEEDEENEDKNDENSGHENAANRVAVFRFSRILTRVYGYFYGFSPVPNSNRNRTRFATEAENDNPSWL